jgi:sugar phosphate permease
MDGVSGYRSWRWIFILEGVITCAVGILAFFVLPDWPEQAKFLSESERNILLAKLARDSGEYTESRTTIQVLKETATDPKVIFWYVKRGQPCELLLIIVVTVASCTLAQL